MVQIMVARPVIGAVEPVRASTILLELAVRAPTILLESAELKCLIVRLVRE